MSKGVCHREYVQVAISQGIMFKKVYQGGYFLTECPREYVIGGERRDMSKRIYQRSFSSFGSESQLKNQIIMGKC